MKVPRTSRNSRARATGEEAKAYCLHEVIARQAAATPNATAVICGEKRQSYAELLHHAESVGRALRHRGVEPGDLVGVYLSRSAALIPGMLGILRSGAGYLPIDPEYPADRVAFMLADAGVGLVLTRSELLPSLPCEVESVLVDDLVCRPHDSTEQDLGDAESPAGTTVEPDDLAYVIYTSGSTGKPKGVMVEHRNVVALFDAVIPLLGFGRTDVWSAFHSCAFDFSVWEIWGALASGGSVVLIPREIARSPREFAQILTRERVTVLSQTPSAFRGLSREILANDRFAADSSLRAVVFGGEALDVASLASWFRRFGDDRPYIYNMYGITETTVHVAMHRMVSEDLRAQAASPIGVALPHLHLHVLDDAGRPVQPGAVGEIYAGGAGVARGYLGRPDLTAERFVADPCSPGARMYRSGDLARLLGSGKLDYVGRRDQQVKIRGYRVELGEVESAISAHPGVREAAVDARPGPTGDDRLCAYIVPVGQYFDEADLRRQLEQVLPPHMVPGTYMQLLDLPLTANGKLDRNALPAPVPQVLDGESATPANPDRKEGDPVSLGLAELWHQFLGASTPDANFFELGGDSFQAIELVSQAQESGIDLQLADIFGDGRLASAAAAVTARQQLADLGSAAEVAAPPLDQGASGNIRRQLSSSE